MWYFDKHLIIFVGLNAFTHEACTGTEQYTTFKCEKVKPILLLGQQD